MNDEHRRLGNEAAARAFAALLPPGHVGVSPTLTVAGMPVIDGWCVAYTSPDMAVGLTTVYYGMGAIRSFAEFGGPAPEVERAALAAVTAANGESA